MRNDQEWKTQAEMIRSLGIDYASDLKSVMRRLGEQYNASKPTTLEDGTEIKTQAMKIDGVNRLVVHASSFPLIERRVLAMASQRQDMEIMAFVTRAEPSYRSIANF